MLYTKKEKDALEKVIQAFRVYLEESQYLDLVWSDKVGYVLLKISVGHRSLEGESLIIEDAETLCGELFSELVMDVLQETESDHCSEGVDAAEGETIRRKFAPYLLALPEYREIAEGCYKIAGNSEKVSDKEKECNNF